MKRKDTYLTVYVHRLVNRMDRQSAAICRRHGLTVPQFGVLEALHTKGPLPVGKVKDLVLSSDGTISVVVRNLEKSGMVACAPDPDDGRKSIVSLTGKGRELVERVIPENEEMLVRELSDWSEHDKSQLVSLLRKHSL